MIFTYICLCRNFDKISLKKKINSQFKKKTIISMKKIIKIVLIFETFSLVFESFVTAIEFSNFVMSDALKSFDFSFVNFNKRQVFSFFVVSFFFLFIETKHRLRLRFCLSNWFASTEISRNLKKNAFESFWSRENDNKNCDERHSTFDRFRWFEKNNESVEKSIVDDEKVDKKWKNDDSFLENK